MPSIEIAIAIAIAIAMIIPTHQEKTAS